MVITSQQINAIRAGANGSGAWARGVRVSLIYCPPFRVRAAVGRGREELNPVEIVIDDGVEKATMISHIPPGASLAYFEEIGRAASKTGDGFNIREPL